MKAPKKKTLRSPEVQEVAREIASIALARVRQNGHMNVRQREQLRRALASAAEHLGWAAMVASADDPVATASKDVAKLTKYGAGAITDDLKEELAGKKTEMQRLEKAAAAIRELAEDTKTTYPTDLTYAHTARDAAAGLITKTEVVTVEDAAEAESAAGTIDKKMTSWDKLREQMILDIKQKQKYLEEVKRDLADFVDVTRRLAHEVLATLH